jgi:endoglucanase
VTSAHFADFWAKMATVFAPNPHVTIGLVNEPNNMSTMTWFKTAQDAITSIRARGFSGSILVPGNGWAGAGSWNDTWYDTGSPQRSSAYGWLNARGTGLPLLDPASNLVVGVHSYADPNAGGGTTTVSSTTISRERVKVAVDWARTNGLKVFVGEIGMYAGAANASANWSDFVSYLDANADTLLGFAWWGCGKPGWWDDVGASGGGHFSITPTGNYTVDTVNMSMIKGALAP